MNFKTLEDNGTEVELPEKVIHRVDNLNRKKFIIAYNNLDIFYGMLAASPQSGTKESKHFKENIEKYFEIQKKKRDI